MEKSTISRQLSDRMAIVSWKSTGPSTLDEVTFTVGEPCQGSCYTLHAGHLQQDQEASVKVQQKICVHFSQKTCAPVETSEDDLDLKLQGIYSEMSF
jgi:hypothetical protein